MENRILRLPEVISRTGISRSTIYRLIDQGEFPKPFSIIGRAKGWQASDIQIWIEGVIRKGKEARNNE